MTPTPVPWRQAWQDALYGPQGFYRTPEGPAGHFATSVAGIPHADAVMARAITTLARRHGLGTIVDLAAGRGSFTAAMAQAAPELSFVGVDIVDRPSDLPESIDWLVSPGGPALPAELLALTSTLIVAHEWLDVVPTTVAQRDTIMNNSGTTGNHDVNNKDVWREVLVSPSTGEQGLGGKIQGSELEWLQTWVDPDTEVAEVGLSRDRAFADLMSRVDDGLVLAVDYGHLRQQRPSAGTLTGYRSGRAVAPVPDGSMDLTAHVAIDSLVPAGADVQTYRQHEMLRDLLGPPATPSRDLAHTRPSAYLAALAEHTADRVLREPGGLGGFWWVLARCTS